MIKNFFLAVLFFVASNIADAKMGLIGAEVGIGPMTDSNAPYFPGIALNTTAGITTGYMLNQNLGLISGCYLSFYNFDNYYDKAQIANETMYYLDVPISVRFILNNLRHSKTHSIGRFNGHNHQKVKVYIQPGVTIGSLLRAHYMGDNYLNHIHYNQDNNYEFHPISLKPFVQLGFLYHAGNIGEINLGMVFSVAVKNAATSNTLQGYNASVDFLSSIIKIGYQFHFNKKTAKNKSEF